MSCKLCANFLQSKFELVEIEELCHVGALHLGADVLCLTLSQSLFF